MMTNTKVVNINIEALRERVYLDLEQWMQDPNHVYIG